MSWSLHHWQKSRTESAGRLTRRARPARFIPRLETLEDRCLPSAAPVVILDPNTTWQLAASPTSNTAHTAQPSDIVAQANFSLTIAYTQAGIVSAQYVLEGNLAVTGNGTFTPLFDALSDSNSPVQQLNVSLSLSSSQPGIPGATQSFDLVLQASNSADGASFKIAVANADTSGKTLSGSSGLLHLQNVDSSNFQPVTPTPSEYLTFSNPSGPAVVTISLPGVFLSNAQTSDGIGNLAAFSRVSSNLVLASKTAGSVAMVNGFSAVSTSFSFPGNEPQPERRSISNYNSLVLADTGPGLSLTISFVQEVNRRSDSPSAQATWTGQPPPLEAVSVKPESPALKLGDKSDPEEPETTFGDIRHQEGSGNRPMEIMVGGILQALQQAKAEDRAKDSVQTAVLEAVSIDFKTAMADSPMPAFPPRQQDGEPMALGNLLLPLNDFLDEGAASNSAAVREFEHEAKVSDDHHLLALRAHHPPPNRMKAAPWRGWFALAETLVAALVALGWPGAFWLEQFSFLRPRRSDYLDE